MLQTHLALLRCPRSGGPLTLARAEMAGDRVRTGVLVAPDETQYPILDFIPRFVPADGYSASFGFQWNLHSRTQYDAVLGIELSRKRLFGVTGWPQRMEGEVILEAGSGSGRFTEHLVQTGATVVSFDYSRAVEANYANNGAHPNLLLVQADMLHMPFARASFDRVLCLGVLQHTPSPQASFHALTQMAKPGADVVTDVYLRTFRNYWLNSRYWVRPLTRRMPPEKLYPLVERYVHAMWPVARALRRLPDRLGEAIVWRLLIADYSRQMPAVPDDKLRDLAVLDTFDMLSPAFDKPATPEEFRRWHRDAALVDVDIRPGSNGLIGRGRARPADPRAI